MSDEYTFTLSRKDYETLLLMLGYATGRAYEQDNPTLFRGFLKLANEINKNNPDWRPYQIPEEAQNA